MKPLRLQGTATITRLTTFFTPLNFTRYDLGCIQLDQLNSLTNFSKHQPSVHMCVCVCVCLSVCLCVCSLLRYCLNAFFPPLPKVGCPKFLEIWSPWGKIMERSGMRFENFY